MAIKIDRAQQEVLPSSGEMPRVSLNISDGVRALGDKIANVYAERLMRQKRDRDVLWASNADRQLKMGLDADFEEIRKTSEADGSDIPGRMQEAIAKRREEMAAGAPSQDAYVAFTLHADRAEEAYSRYSRSVQSQQYAAYTTETLDASRGQASVRIRNNPSAFDEEVQTLDQTLESLADNGELSKSALDEYGRKAKAMYAEDAVGGLIQTAPDLALKALEDGDYDAYFLDGGRKSMLVDKARAAVGARANAAANAMKRYVGVTQAAILNGEMDTIDPGQLQSMLSTLEGTPEGNDLAMAVAAGPALAGIRAAPWDQLQSFVSSESTRDNIPINQLFVHNASLALASKAAGEMKRAPLEHYAGSVLGAPLEPMPDGGAMSPDYNGWFERRLDLAQTAGAHAGTLALPYTDDEIDVMAATMNSAKALGGAAQLMALGEMKIDKMSVPMQNLLAEKVGAKDPLLGLVVHYGSRNPKLATELLTGDTLMKGLEMSKTDFVPPTEFAAGYGDNLQAVADANEAAKRVYAARVPTGTTFQDDVWAAAWHDVAGGRNLEWKNGTQILRPRPNMGSRDLRETLDKLRDSDFVTYGHYEDALGNTTPAEDVPMVYRMTGEGEPLTAEAFLEDGAMVSYTQDTVKIKVGTGIVGSPPSKDGRPTSGWYVFDLGKYADDRAFAPAPAKPLSRAGEAARSIANDPMLMQ